MYTPSPRTKSGAWRLYVPRMGDAFADADADALALAPAAGEEAGDDDPDVAGANCVTGADGCMVEGVMSGLREKT
jgi:hypothetical protein